MSTILNADLCILPFSGVMFDKLSYKRQSEKTEREWIDRQQKWTGQDNKDSNRTRRSPSKGGQTDRHTGYGRRTKKDRTRQDKSVRDKTVRDQTVGDETGQR